MNNPNFWGDLFGTLGPYLQYISHLWNLWKLRFSPSNLSCLTLPGEELLRPLWRNQSPHFRNPRHVAKGDVEAILPNLENPTGINGEMVSSGTLKIPRKNPVKLVPNSNMNRLKNGGCRMGFFSNGRGRFLKDLTYLPPINPREKRFLLTFSLNTRDEPTHQPTKQDIFVTKMPCAPLGKVNWNTPCVASWKALLKSCNSESWQPMAGRNPKTHKHRKLVLLQISCVF